MDFSLAKPILDKDLENYTIKPIGGRACYYWIHYCLIHNFTKSKDKWPLILGVIGDSIDHIVKWMYLWPNNLDLMAYLRLYLDDQSKLTHIEQYIADQTKNAVEKIKAASLGEASAEELSALVKFAFEKFSNSSYVAATLRFVDLSIQHYFNTVLSADAPKADIIRFAGIPHIQSYSIKEELELLSLALKIRNKQISKKETEKSLENIHGRYCWYVCGYYNEKARSLDSYKKALDEMVSGDPRARIDEIERRATNELIEREKILKPMNKEQKIVADMAALSTALKDYYKYMSNNIIYSLEPLFNEIAKRTAQTVEFIKELDDAEISQLMMGNKLDRLHIEERTRHNTIIAFDGHFDMRAGKDADLFGEKYLMLISDDKEYTGRIASKGLAKSTAKIVRSSNEFYKVQTGDIIVVINTTPDYVTILKKVAGIVAEEGGITAHVSIISREFNIPAVVGIPRISEILHDGDLVEVDADKGVVRILERAK